MASPVGLRRIAAAPECLTIEWEDGRTSEFASLWLRDNVHEDRDPHNGQRLIDITDLPEKPRIRSAAAEQGSVRIDWEGDPRGACFGLDWLAAHGGGGQRRPELVPRPWLGGAGLIATRDFAWASAAEARVDSRVRLTWLTRLLQDGLAFLSGVPAQETALLEAMPLVGRVLETNYGLTFDVRSVPQPENLAYSDLGLGLHTDNPYRDPVPGFQALHALIPSGEGGESLFADGFALAEHLRATAPEAFAQLTRTAVPFHYRSSDADLYAERPLIQLSVRGEVAAVHYNSRSIAPLSVAARETEAFYAAYRRFAALLRDTRFQLNMRLGPATIVVFDNQRILHGRTAFSSARQPRHLRGCYLSRDSVHNETALLRRKLAATGA
jgi:alpha-ketoglutarate-dependent taurine dioxygenase